MCNSIFLGKKTIPKARDGEEVEITVKGTYHTDEDGMRTLDVMEVDGDPIMSPDKEGCGLMEDHEDLMSQDADDAIRLFIIKTRKG